LINYFYCLFVDFIWKKGILLQMFYEAAERAVLRIKKPRHQDFVGQDNHTLCDYGLMRGFLSISQEVYE